MGWTDDPVFVVESIWGLFFPWDVGGMELQLKIGLLSGHLTSCVFVCVWRWRFIAEKGTDKHISQNFDNMHSVRLTTPPPPPIHIHTRIHAHARVSGGGTTRDAGGGNSSSNSSANGDGMEGAEAAPATAPRCGL